MLWTSNTKLLQHLIMLQEYRLQTNHHILYDTRRNGQLQYGQPPKGQPPKGQLVLLHTKKSTIAIIDQKVNLSIK